jgi:hypothetical protein
LGTDGERCGLVVFDRATGWISCYAVPDKGAVNATKALAHFAGRDPIQSFYTDAAPELEKAASTLGWEHPTAVPGRPKTNGVAERAVRAVLEGGRAVLEHSGVPQQFWPQACDHWCFSQNVAMREGNSAWNRRHKKGHFKGNLVPFGSLVDFKPSPVYLQKHPLCKFSPRALPGVFLGYYLHPGGIWRGEYIVAALDDFRGALRGLSETSPCNASVK